MAKDVKKKRSKRASVMARYSILIFIIMVVAAWIIYNMFRNTVIDAPHWNELAKKELSRMTTKIAPERGDILAADGTVLATTLQYYTLRIDFRSEGFDWEGYVKEKDALADSLNRYYPIAGGVTAWQDSLESVLRRGTRPRGWRLIHNVTYADYLQIKEFPFFKGRTSGKNGLLSEPIKRRRMPYGEMAKLSIGVVSFDTAGDQRGYSGLEKALDSLLFGTPGVSRQVNFTRGIGKWVEKPAVRGWDVTSTIDIQMQDIVENCLLDRLKQTRAEWATAVLMEVATGEIKAISNFEEDPEHPGEGIYIEAMNRAVNRFEPGSVVKPISLMIAIDDGYVTDLDSVVEIGHSYRAFGSGSPITDSHFNSQLTVRGIIEQSSNIGMAKIMSRHYRSAQGWHDRVAQTGFLDKLQSGIGEERAPNFPVDSRSPLVTLSRQFYGYGCEIPPLHTLSIYNAIANDGKYVRPHLVKSLHREEVDSVVPIDYIRRQVCSPRTAAMMRECLSAVVNGDHGTARSLKNPYVTLAGKTGTAYSVDPDTRKYDTKKKRLAFCGFFPVENPKYSCVVLTFHPRENYFGAASTSGVVMRDIALALYARGLLDNESDYRAGAPDRVEPPVAFASADDGLVRAVRSVSGTTPSRIAQRRVESGLPDVCGMGLREAVVTLEGAGAEVAFSGVGHVDSQEPRPGTPVAPGTRVRLRLKP